MGNVYHQGHSHDHQILQAILKSLRYEGMDDRREMLKEACEGTFQWAFNIGEVRSGKWDWSKVELSFKPWLEGDDEGIFSFVGKAGCGKSTFMKFLGTHPDIDEGLQTWLRGKRLLRAEHFFWIAGTTTLQRSYDGLLRNLLQQCLLALSVSEQQTDAQTVKHALKSRWSAFKTHAPWDRRTMESVLSNLASSVSDAKFLFLIDGLDECEPQERLDELARKMDWISHLPNVKLCVSCRPWETLTRNFLQRSTIRIDQLTQNDMKVYSKHRLLEAADFELDMDLGLQEGSEGLDELVKSIVDTAEGVFLWTELAINDLAGQIRKGSDLKKLRQTLKDFPPDLDAYFGKLIYERIPKFGSNESDTASALKLAMVSRNRLKQRHMPLNFHKSLINFWLLKTGNLAEGMSWKDIGSRTYSELEDARMSKATIRYLSETCRDLLVVRSQAPGMMPTLVMFTVEFLHRSVFDFLTSDAIKLKIDSTSPRHFDDDVFFHELNKMRWFFVLNYMSEHCIFLHRTLASAFDIMHATGEQDADEQYTSVCDSMVATRVFDCCVCFGEGNFHFGRSSVQTALRSDCTEFISAVVRKWPHVAVTNAGLPIESTLISMLLSAWSHAIKVAAKTSIVDFLKLALACGAEPNGPASYKRRIHCKNSAWAKWLADTKRFLENLSLALDELCQWQEQVAKVASLMIQHGANPGCTPCIADHKGSELCSHVSIEDISRSIFTQAYIAQMQTLRIKYACDATYRSARRKQRLRAVRSYILSEQRKDAIPAARDTSWHEWKDQPLKFVESLMETNSDGRAPTASCSMCDKRLSPIGQALCMDCGNFAWLYEECCSATLDGSHSFFHAKVYDDRGIVIPEHAHTMIQLSHTAWTPAELDEPVLIPLRKWYHDNQLPEDGLWQSIRTGTSTVSATAWHHD